MNGTLADNLAKGATAINAIAAEMVTYIRGGRQTSLRMRPTNVTYPAKTMSAIVEQWSGTDWIVTPDEWARADLTTPARGDTIKVNRNNVDITYELVAPPGMQLWNLATFGEVYAIHSQLISTT